MTELPKDNWLRCGHINSERGKAVMCDQCFEMQDCCYFVILENPDYHEKLTVCLDCEYPLTHNLKSFMRKKWWASSKGNPQTWEDGHRVIVHPKGNGWSACIVEDDGPGMGGIRDGTQEFMPTTHTTQDAAKRAAYDFLCQIVAEKRRKYEEERARREAEHKVAVEAATAWLRQYFKGRAVPYDMVRSDAAKAGHYYAMEDAGVMEAIEIDHHIYYRLADKDTPTPDKDTGVLWRRRFISPQYREEWDAYLRLHATDHKAAAAYFEEHYGVWGRGWSPKPILETELA